MPSDPDSGAGSSGFGLDLDELLSEAVDAVEKIERRAPPVRGRRSAGDAPRSPQPDDESDLAVELDIDLEETLTSLTDTEAEETQAEDTPTLGQTTMPDAAVVVDAGDSASPEDAAQDDDDVDDLLIVELEARLARLRQAHDEQRARAREAQDEVRRLRGTVRRYEEQLAQKTARLEREREMRRGAEEQLSTVRRRMEQLEANLRTLRRRSQRERDEARVIGTSRSVDTLLPILDNLERAISHRDADPARVVEGIAMIVQQFHQSLAQLGVGRVVCAPGVLFDPEVHEAMAQVETLDLLPGSVVEQLRPGYLYEGRLLRPARVTVARAPSDGGEGDPSTAPLVGGGEQGDERAHAPPTHDDVDGEE